MKKSISVLLSVLLISVSVFPSFAAEETTSVNNKINFEEHELEETDIAKDKLYCNATLEDDFDDSSVIVMFNNETSIEFNDFTAQDFSEINAAEVKDLTKCTIDTLQVQQDTEINEGTNIISGTLADSNMTDNNEINISSFNQVIKIELNTDSKQGVLDAIKVLEKRDDILIAQPNYCYELANTPNDERLDEQWAVDKINLEQAWDITTGSKNVKVGVIDSGIDNRHQDLSGNINTNLSKSFVDEYSATLDDIKHGTHVAGIIGAVGNNEIGIAGTCWNIDLVSLRVSAQNGKVNTDAVLEAVEYASAQNIDILNCSFVLSPSSDLCDDCLKSKMRNFNGLIVCAAGNNKKNIDSNVVYPASFDLDNIITVAASDQNDSLCDNWSNNGGSNYGVTSVDLAAPGVNICSTIVAGMTGIYQYSYGTSMAAPYVAGVAALIKSKYPNLTTSEIKDAILNGVDKISSLNGKIATGGRLNAKKALDLAGTTSYKLSYSSNGGSGTMSSIRGYNNVAVNLTSNNFTKSGYSFWGWYIKDQYGNWSKSNGTWASGTSSRKLYYDKASMTYNTETQGTTVTAYAQWKLTSSIILGDANLDGVIDISDVTFIQTQLANNQSFSEANKIAADVNHDGVVNMEDVTQIQMYLSGSITEF